MIVALAVVITVETVMEVAGVEAVSYCEVQSYSVLLLARMPRIPVRRSAPLETWGFPKIKGTLFGGPHNKDYSILGSILGSPYFGKLPHGVGLRNFLLSRNNVSIHWRLLRAG